MLLPPEIKLLAAEHGVKYVQDVNHDGVLTKSDVFATKKLLVEKGLLKVEPKAELAKA